MPVLVVKSKDGIQTFLLEEGKPLFIGRADECDVRLDSSAVSRKHAVILFKDGICGVKDLGSFNGTQLNDKTIQIPHQLTDQDTLKISSFVIRLYVKDPEQIAFDGPASSADATTPDFGHPAQRSLSPDSRAFTKGDLLIPRAMRNSSRQTLPPGSSRSRDTEIYRPGRDTSTFMMRNGEDAPASVDAPAGTPESAPPDGSPYFTPFPLANLDPDEGAAADSPPDSGEVAADAEPGPEDLSFFEEPSLAPLFIIPNNADTSGDSVLARVKDVGEATPMAIGTNEAEAVIPLMDEAPLITSLEADPAEAQSAADAPLHGLDTGTYTLPPDTGEMMAVSPDTGEYQRAPDTAEMAAVAPETGEYRRPLDTDEFPIPDVEEAGWNAASEESDAERDEEGGLADQEDTGSQRFIADVGKVGSGKTSLITRSSTLEGVDNIPIASEFMACINTRLSLFSLLYDLVEERKNFRAEYPNLPPEVEQELTRQDQELDNLPFADEADLLIQAMRSRQERVDAAVLEREKEGKKSTSAASSPEMRAAEELAISQWMLIRDSNREALPAIYREAYRLAADEPLARELMQQRISHGRLMGGGVYLLALQVLEQVANRERRRLARMAKKLSQDGLEEEGDGGFLGMFGNLGKLANNIKNRKQIRDEISKLEREDRVNAIRAELAARETAFMLKTLAVEFRQMYKQVALRYAPGREMPWFVRAFLRYGVIGFRPWWMREDVRKFIVQDCQDNVVSEFERGAGDITILFADEYLTAVSQMDVTPSPDENLEAQDKNSVEWKTDRAYRRIVNARSYNVLMEEMLTHMDVTVKYYESQEIDYERRIMDIKERGYAGAGENIFDLQTTQRSFATRKETMSKQMERIKTEIVPSILEAVEEAEGRFRKGELKIPEPETLVRRETEAIADIRRRIEGGREPFPPMVVRENFNLKSDVVNTRGAVRTKIMEMEGLDPGIFVNVIVPSQSKANRVELRLTPLVVIVPAFGLDPICSMPREGMEGGHLVLPTCISRPGVRGRLFANLLADFRWGSSRNLAGRDLMNSDTLAGHFIRLRRQARTWPKAKREKALFYTEVSEGINWRRVYEMYMADALSGGRQLYMRNPELYQAIIGKFIDLPEGVKKIVR